MKFVKDKEYYENLDKRTKEYKEWKEWYDSQPQETGLGDDIASVTEATGIDKVAKSVAKALGYEDCGCDKRKEKLNKYFKRKRQPKCLEEEEFIELSEFFQASRPRVSVEEQQMVYRVYNRVFDDNKTPTRCLGCWKQVTNKMKRLINAHKE